jgi:hypothetical protein
MSANKMPGPWHVALRDPPGAFERTSTPRSALASPEAANNLLATTLALARETAVSDALCLDRPRPALGGGGA